MKNLTLTIDDNLADTLARMASEQNVGVDQFVRTELSAAVERVEARRRLRDLVERAPIALEPGWKWSREDTYDRPMLRGYKRPPLRGGG